LKEFYKYLRLLALILKLIPLRYHRETKKSTLIDFGLSHKDGLHHLQRLSFPNGKLKIFLNLLAHSKYLDIYKREALKKYNYKITEFILMTLYNTIC
jgi:hypothetical protein